MSLLEEIEGSQQEQLILGIEIGILLMLVAVGVGIYVFFRKKKRLEDLEKNTQGSENSSRKIRLSFNLPQIPFSYEELERATNGFSKVNLIGKGRFGNVYKGVLPEGKEVAIKQLKLGCNLCEIKTEVDIITRIHHRNLVKLVGYCISGAHKILVYDFVPNHTLDFHLHGKKRPTMNWPTRMKVAKSFAKGLVYLHEECKLYLHEECFSGPRKIIHRNIKATNILLDNNFEAMIADFGLAKCLPRTVNHVAITQKETFGYMPPEYFNRELTKKSDVFSYGVVLLELITGQKALHKNQSLVVWARPLLKKALENGNFDGLVDPRLQNDYNSTEMTRMVGCAFACVHRSAEFRPGMEEVILALRGSLSLGIPSASRN